MSFAHRDVWSAIWATGDIWGGGPHCQKEATNMYGDFWTTTLPWETRWRMVGLDCRGFLLHDLLSSGWIWVFFFGHFPHPNTSPWIILCYGFHYFFIFRNNFGLIVPAIAKHFNAGRADAVLTSSFMTLLLLGSGLFWRIAKLILGSELSGIAVAILQHFLSWYQILNLRATGCCLVDLLQPPKGVLIFVSV